MALLPWSRRVVLPQVLDAIGSGPACRIGRAAEDLCDLGVRQPGDVVIRHRLALLLRQCPDRLPQVTVAVSRHAERGRRLGYVPDRHGLPLAGPEHVDGLAVRDRDQPCLGIRVIRQIWVGAHRRQERLRPRVLGIVDAEDHPAHPQHGPSVLLYDLLERLLHPHARADASQTAKARPPVTREGRPGSTRLTIVSSLSHQADAPGMPNVR